jgi:hypothetical protein
MFSMKLAAPVLAGLVLAVTLPGGAAQAAPQHDHAAHAHGTAVAPPAQRWAADATLRDGMGRIHSALEELRHYEMGHMSEAMALDRVGLIEQAASDIFTKCKLTPQADAALHGMLVPLLAAAQTLRQHPQDVAAVAAMRAAVADYPRYFDGPDWTDAAATAAPHDAH